MDPKTRGLDSAIKSKDLYDLLEKYKGKKVQVEAFDTFYIGKVQKVDHRKGQVEIKDGDDTVTLEVERIVSLNLV